MEPGVLPGIASNPPARQLFNPYAPARPLFRLPWADPPDEIVFGGARPHANAARIA